MRRMLIALTVLLVVGMTATAAMAASPHFKKGGVPVCTFSGTTSIPVTCTGTLAGLGNEDLNIHVSVSGFALYSARTLAETPRLVRTRCWPARLPRTRRFQQTRSRTGT